MRTQKRGGKGWWPFTKRDQRSPTSSPTRRVHADQVRGHMESRVSAVEQTNIALLKMLKANNDHMKIIDSTLVYVRSELARIVKSSRSPR